MASVNKYTVGKVMQLIPINDDQTEFNTDFYLKANDEFHFAVCDQEVLDNGAALDFKQSTNKQVSGNIKSSASDPKSYYIALKSINEKVDVNVSLAPRPVEMTPKRAPPQQQQHQQRGPPQQHQQQRGPPQQHQQQRGPPQQHQQQRGPPQQHQQQRGPPQQHQTTTWTASTATWTATWTTSTATWTNVDHLNADSNNADNNNVDLNSSNVDRLNNNSSNADHRSLDHLIYS